VNLGSRGSISESQKLAIRYDTGIALSHRNDSHDTVALRYRGTICTVFPMTRTVSYDTYLVSYDTNLYGWDDLEIPSFGKMNYNPLVSPDAAHVMM
jgi:hypothetical protein